MEVEMPSNNPYDDVAQYMRELNRYSDPMRDVISAIEEQQRILRAAGSFDSIVDGIREQLASLQFDSKRYAFDASALPALNGSAVYAQVSEMLEEQRRLATLPEIYDFSGALLNASERIRETLANIEASARLYNPSPSLLGLALDLPIRFQSFTVNQLEAAKDEKGEVVDRRVEVVEAAGELLDRSEEAVHIAAEMASESSSAEEEKPKQEHEKASDNPQLTTNLFEALELHAPKIIASRSTASIQVAIEETIPGRICEAGRGIAERVFEINRFSEYGGGDSIFKPTNLAMMSMAALPCVIAPNSVEFGTVVDRLFFLLYEGSGEAKRITAIISFDDLPELLRLKHLRLGYRHDLDHGRPADALKKKRDAGEAFKGLIGKPYPTESHEWPLAQLHLYEQLSTMLDRIFERLIALRA
ncbi:MAG TPA: hypothetical protein VFR31_12730 [Thermoanaerobaculia bacterium]|nr:hypothetical protein [Thermoanaerobaculia bacterium]